jgi:phenylalanyl-tRNA synthetase alpha chain
MIQKLDEIGARALSDIEKAASLDALEGLRVSVLGKKGALSEVLRGLGQVGPDERPKIGAKANEWKAKIEAALDARVDVLGSADLDRRLKEERIDVTAPARVPHRGSLHVLTQVQDRIVRIFSRMGFDVTQGPEIETDALCFDAMNIPKDHPARDMQDTFFIGEGVILRTHTSPVQARAMRGRKPPLRVLCPGAVYRVDNDATHSPMFHQVEGLWIDRDVKMSDLKGTLEFFAREMFGAAAKIRLRPSFFPFVEPGVEIDVSCFKCRDKRESSCTVCKGTGWLEIMGAGMVHPEVFRKSGYDPAEVKGFAFGMGVERIGMLLHRIPDLRLFYSGDVRFLGQF